MYAYILLIVNIRLTRYLYKHGQKAVSVSVLAVKTRSNQNQRYIYSKKKFLTPFHNFIEYKTEASLYICVCIGIIYKAGLKLEIRVPRLYWQYIGNFGSIKYNVRQNVFQFTVNLFVRDLSSS